MKLGWLVLVGCGRVAFDGVPDSATDSPLDAELSPMNRVFVTSTSHPFTIGLAAADDICRLRAESVGLTGQFVAWLSTSSVNARDRLGAARGWVRMDGRPFADTVADLAFNKTIYSPVAFTELGSPAPPTVRTGTNVIGVPTGELCGDWTNTTGVGSVITGSTTATASGWTNSAATPCTSSMPFYCFQVDRVLPVELARTAGRMAFLSTTKFNIGDGLAAADAVCMGEAATAAYPGTFVAALATTAASAASRFSSAGPTWVRPDGLPLAQTATEVLAGTWQTTLNVETSGAYISEFSLTGGSFTAPSATTCSDWTSSTGGNTRVGKAYDTAEAFAFPTGIIGCANMIRLYCLEQ